MSEAMVWICSFNQVVSKSLPYVFLQRFTCNFGTYSRDFPLCFELVSLLDQSNVHNLCGLLCFQLFIFHCNSTPRGLVCGFNMVKLMLDILMHFHAFKFHHTSEDLFMTTEVEYNWNFSKMRKVFNPQFISSTAISDS